MDWQDETPVIPCPECGKLFRPQSGQTLCRACMDEAARANMAEVPEQAPANDDANVQEMESTTDAIPCVRCHEAPALKGEKWCLACKGVLRKSLGLAATDLSDKLRKIKAKKAGAIHLLAAVEEKRARTSGLVTEVEESPQMKTY